MTFVPSIPGLSQQELVPIFSRMEAALEGPCGPYLRAFTCALYLPPCREQAVVPCRELCLANVNECARGLGPAFSAQELADMRESCASMPLEGDPTFPCHNGLCLTLSESYSTFPTGCDFECKISREQ